MQPTGEPGQYGHGQRGSEQVDGSERAVSAGEEPDPVEHDRFCARQRRLDPGHRAPHVQLPRVERRHAAGDGQFRFRTLPHPMEPGLAAAQVERLTAHAPEREGEHRTALGVESGAGLDVAQQRRCPRLLRVPASPANGDGARDTHRSVDVWRHHLRVEGLHHMVLQPELPAHGQTLLQTP